MLQQMLFTQEAGNTYKEPMVSCALYAINTKETYLNLISVFIGGVPWFYVSLI